METKGKFPNLRVHKNGTASYNFPARKLSNPQIRENQTLLKQTITVILTFIQKFQFAVCDGPGPVNS
jgi:hypothetical protein